MRKAPSSITRCPSGSTEPITIVVGHGVGISVPQNVVAQLGGLQGLPYREQVTFNRRLLPQEL